MIRKLEDIVKNCKVLKISGDEDKLKGKVLFDSRKVEEGDLFIAVKGTIEDGHEYISSAIERGAAFIVCEEIPHPVKKGVTFIKVEDSSRALGMIAANFYKNPSDDLKVIGITGTNGKTTIASLLYEITMSLGYITGLFSTIKVKFNDIELPATHTTPDPVRLQSVFQEMLDKGVEYVFMEVSSHAIHQNRISGIKFSGGIFTNLSHDHLDYHGTFRDYLETKKRFFDELPSDAFALVNLDDRNGKVMVQNTQAKINTYSLRTMADFRAKVVESHFEGNLLSVNGEELWTRLPGLFNAYNCLAVYGTGILLGFNREELLMSISEQKSVEGRFEIIRSERGVTGIVDYAHTPDALANVLQTINEIRKRRRRLLTIIGAGGDRDRAKRPMMAKIAAEKSDRVILTSDNPRNEDPETIITDMKQGLDPVLIKKIISITGRDEAIKAACSFAEENDIILLAGKGHETYQEIKGQRHHFDDREKLRQYLKT